MMTSFSGLRPDLGHGLVDRVARASKRAGFAYEPRFETSVLWHGLSSASFMSRPVFERTLLF
ncbi:MAG: hypothetical protein DMG57_32975 [Acidobacteria bacterium]|nr:MAG: hypothetical protein DMG57_32975 [Acidobacteriota bacterium]